VSVFIDGGLGLLERGGRRGRERDAALSLINKMLIFVQLTSNMAKITYIAVFAVIGLCPSVCLSLCPISTIYSLSESRRNCSSAYIISTLWRAVVKEISGYM